MKETAIEHPDEEPDRDQARDQCRRPSDRKVGESSRIGALQIWNHQYRRTGDRDDPHQKRKLGSSQGSYA